MQKLTVFSAILSLSIILAIGDLVSHDYLTDEDSLPNIEEDLETPEMTQDTQTEETIDSNIEDQTTEASEGQAATEAEGEAEPESELENEEIDLSSESTDLSVLMPTIGEDIFLKSGFFDPVIKNTIYSGYLFQFLPFSDGDAYIYQWNLFDGESFIGSVYEIKYLNETASFQGYLALRQAGSGASDLGSVNEVNNYKDASFYFNHATKSQTVHLVIRSGKNIYAFDYAHRNHESMKNLFDLLP